MEDTDRDTLYFQTCCGLDGTPRRLQVGRWNGRRKPLFHPDWETPWLLESREEIDVELLQEICVNLTPLERSTWLRLIDGQPIANIAHEGGVTRAAIYARIHGKTGHGGMVAKNPYVRHWWRLRQRSKEQ